MTIFSFVVKDSLGIHARPAGLLVKEANKYECEIKVEHGGKTADAKSIFSVMGLGAKFGDCINFSFEGKDEAVASREISDFLEKNL